MVYMFRSVGYVAFIVYLRMYPVIRVILDRHGLFACWPVPTWSGMNPAVARKLSTLSHLPIRYACTGPHFIMPSSLAHTVHTDPHIMQSLANTVGTDPYLVQSLTNTVRTDIHLMHSLVNTVRTDLHLMQSLVNTSRTDPYLVQSLAITVRTESYLVQSLVKTVCIDLLLMQPLANTVRTGESYLVPSPVNTVCTDVHLTQSLVNTVRADVHLMQPLVNTVHTDLHFMQSLGQNNANGYIPHAITGQNSKYLGVLRPVNQYGYIRARYILSSHNVKNVYVLKLVYMY